MGTLNAFLALNGPFRNPEWIPWLAGARLYGLVPAGAGSSTFALACMAIALRPLNGAAGVLIDHPIPCRYQVVMYPHSAQATASQIMV